MVEFLSLRWWIFLINNFIINKMKNHFLLTVLLLMLCSMTMYAQKKITGQVLEPNGQAIIGATILEKGTTNGTITDFDGNFELTSTSEKPIIQVSYIGYKTQTITVTSNKPLVVTMKTDAIMLEEAVVIGYAKQL